MLQRIIMSIVAIKEHEKDYKEFPKYISILDRIMNELSDFSFKPIVIMYEARYYVDYIKDRGKALELYDKAIIGAEFLNDEQLKKIF